MSLNFTKILLYRGSGEINIGKLNNLSTQSLHIQPGDSGLLRIHGRIDLERGDYEKALNDYSTLSITRIPEEILWIKRSAENFYVNGETDLAFEWWKFIILWQPRFPDGYLGLGRYYEQAMDWQNAFNIYTDYKGKNPEISLAICRVLVNQSKYDTADDWCTNALLNKSISEELARDAYYFRGLAQFENGNYLDADNDFQEVISYFPRNQPGWMQFTSYLKLGQHQLILNNPVGARKQFILASRVTENPSQQKIVTEWIQKVENYQLK